MSRPAEKPPETAPSIFINAIKIAGQSQRISEVGETDIRGPELAAGQNQIEIGFGSFAFGRLKQRFRSINTSANGANMNGCLAIRQTSRAFVQSARAHIGISPERRQPPLVYDASS